ncbi:MAG TPA: CDP-alcohol phosphatidyltransferase family protein [Vicinamibacterales bacterium]|nr:CDP-alcohol phosphatidyltransferase family protein [Vicinamibacterales bacterium]
MDELDGSRDVEELADAYIHRPLARPLVRLLTDTAITPDHVTGLSGAIGFAGAVAIALGARAPVFFIAAAALGLGSAVLDCADGQLARARGHSSPHGAALDGYMDSLVGVTTVAAATVAAAHVYRGNIWLLGFGALCSWFVQCFLFDAMKERYLSGLGVSHDASKLAMAARREAGETFGRAATSRDPRAGTFDDYASAIRRAMSFLPAMTDSAGTKGRMRLWTYLGLGTHVAVAYGAALLAAVWPAAISALLLAYLYPMNALLVFLLVAEAIPA